MTAGKKEASVHELSIRAYASLGFAIVCLLIGLPLWWKTTTVYRIKLPYHDIANLSRSQITFTCYLTIVACSDYFKVRNLDLFKRELETQLFLYQNISTYREIVVQYRVHSRFAYDEEKELLSQVDTLKELSYKMTLQNILDQYGHYHLFLLPRQSKLSMDSNSDKNIYLGRHRNVFIFLPNAENHATGIVSNVTEVFRDIIVNEQSILQIVNNTAKVKVTKHLDPDKNSMRSVKSHAQYDIVFSLLNPQPNAFTVLCDFNAAVQKYMRDFFEKLSVIAAFKVESHMLYFTALGLHPKKNQKTGNFEVSQEQLPHSINAIEKRLASYVSTNPVLHFVVYITPSQITPLVIIGNNGTEVQANAFLSPRWGGIHIYNMPVKNGTGSLPIQHTVDLEISMKVFLTQLRLFLGISNHGFNEIIHSEMPAHDGINDWEFDTLIWQRTTENLLTTINTLQSLAQLLEEISNIVINDEIGHEVSLAVASVQESCRLLKLGDIKEGYKLSQQALIASEKAFFDPSLLALLYFPDDQKFAIYIPLFLPISIPVIMSLRHLRYIFQEKEKRKTD